jgi:hypothetical protein
MGLTKDLGALPRVITVSNSNNVGVNIINPDAIFTVNKTNTDFTNASAGHILLDNSSSIGQSSIYYRINGTVRGKVRVDQIGSVNYIANGGNHEFWTGGDAGAGSVKLFVASGGNIGMGTTSPSSLLHLKQSADTFSNGLKLEKGTGASTYSVVIGGDNSLYLGYGTTPSASPNNLLVITSGGNALIGTTTNNGNRLQVNGSVSATSFDLSGNYNSTVNTDSSWTSYQTLIPVGTFSAFGTYIVSIWWHFSGSSNQPYYYNCAFLWVTSSTNGGSTDNEFTPIGSTHTGGTGSNISFRSIAGVGSSTGLQARLNGFPTTVGFIYVKATLIQKF